MSNRDGKKVNIYCLNYGLAKKNNILWGKPQGSEYRKYFIERPFNYTNLILEEIKEVQIIAVYYSGSNWQKNIKYR